MKTIFLFLFVLAILPPAFARTPVGTQLGLEVASCPESKNGDCLIEERFGISNKPIKESLTTANFETLKTLVFKYPDLDWVSVLDSEKKTGSFLVEQMPKFGVSLDAAKMRRLEYFASTKSELTAAERKEKALIYAEAIPLLSAKFPPEQLRIKFTTDAMAARAKLTLEAAFKAENNLPDRPAPAAAPLPAASASSNTVCDWKGQPMGLPLPKNPSLTDHMSCAGVATCRDGSSVRYERRVSCVLKSELRCAFADCAKAGTNMVLVSKDGDSGRGSGGQGGTGQNNGVGQ